MNDHAMALKSLVEEVAVLRSDDIPNLLSEET